MLKRWISPLLLGFIVAGCASNDTTEPPSPLVDFEPEAQFVKLWSTDTGTGADKYLLKLKPYLSGDTIYTVDHEGQLSAIDRINGKRIWQVETELAVSAGVGGGT